MRLPMFLLVLAATTYPVAAFDTMDKVRRCLSMKDFADGAYVVLKDRDVLYLEVNTNDEQMALDTVHKYKDRSRHTVRKKVLQDCLVRYEIIDGESLPHN